MTGTETSGPDRRPGGRRRRVALIAGVSLASAAAILVPLGILAMQDDGDRAGNDTAPPSATPQPSPDASTTPSPTSSPTPTEPSPSVTPTEPRPWDVTGLTTGSPPGVPYVAGARLRVPGEPTVTVGGDGMSALARLSDGRWLAATTDSETGATTYELRDATWALLERFAGRDYESFALSPSGELAVWARPDGAVLALRSGATTPARVGSLPARGRVRAVRGTDCATDCVISGDRTAPDGRYDAAAWELTAGGRVRPLGQELLVVTDASDTGLVTGLTDITDDGSCSALVDTDRDATLWRTCDNTLDAFSPDGTLVLASEAYHDGWGSGEVAVYETATGQRLWDLVRDGESFSGYQQAVWEGDTHLLVTTYAAGAWAVVRIGVDGAMEYAVPPVPGSDMENPFRMVGR